MIVAGAIGFGVLGTPAADATPPANVVTCANTIGTVAINPKLWAGGGSTNKWSWKTQGVVFNCNNTLNTGTQLVLYAKYQFAGKFSGARTCDAALNGPGIYTGKGVVKWTVLDYTTGVVSTVLTTFFGQTPVGFATGNGVSSTWAAPKTGVFNTVTLSSDFTNGIVAQCAATVQANGLGTAPLTTPSSGPALSTT